MARMPAHKYRPLPPVELPDRRWPAQRIREAPHWCSVDLRDGNQALVEPMGVERKRRLFQELVRLGFREIEVGFPGASQPDFDFVRLLVEEDLVPPDVTIQVLTQARESLVERTFDALRGARRAIVHLYNSTSPVQRRVVFDLPRAGVVEIATRGVGWIRALAAEQPELEVVLEYSPESFSQTELDFALEISSAVMEVWEPTPARKMILNLPATVECATPNHYADQIEWFERRVPLRPCVTLSVHPHNDRGTAVAAAELALLAGAERVEGTLFGNGERTGNVDIVTLALNLLTQGVDPGLALEDVDRVVQVAEHCTRMPVHPRHPYVGRLVYTAFSGSHQDAIRKGLAARRVERGPWQVPYLPLDPADVGRAYEPLVRINSQSGKGGVAFVLEQDYGLVLPRGLQIELGARVQQLAERTGGELAPAQLFALFESELLSVPGPLALLAQRSRPVGEDGARTLLAEVRCGGRVRSLRGRGNGPVDAFVDALRRGLGLDVRVTHFSEQAVGEGSDALALAIVELALPDGSRWWGAARHANIVSASLEAIVCAINRSARARAMEDDAAAAVG